MESVNVKQGCLSIDCSCGRRGSGQGHAGASLKPIRTLFNGLRTPDGPSSPNLLPALSPISPSASSLSFFDDMRPFRSGYSSATSMSSTSLTSATSALSTNPSPSSPSFILLGARMLKKVGNDVYRYEDITPAHSPVDDNNNNSNNTNLTFLQMLRQSDFSRTPIMPPHEQPNYTPPTPIASPLLLSPDPEKIKPLIPRRKPVRRRNQEHNSPDTPTSPYDSEAESSYSPSTSSPPLAVSIPEEVPSPVLNQTPSWKVGDEHAFSPVASVRIPNRKPVSRSPTKAAASPPPPAPVAKSVPPPLLFNASDDVLLHILAHLPDIESVHNFALVHRRFLNLVRSEEHYLFKIVLKRTNRSAWSVLEKRNPEATTFKDYSSAYKYCDNIVKSLVGRIRERCKGFLRQEWREACEKEHTRSMERAIWTFWDFTSTFGTSRDNIADIDEQINWLYNRCQSSEEVLALSEVASCFPVLIRFLCQTFERTNAARGDTVLQAAKAFGVVAADSTDRDARTTMEIFAGYLMTLGPQYIFVIEGYLIPRRNEPYSDNLEQVYTWLDSMDALEHWNPKVTQSREEMNLYEYFLRRPACEVYARFEQEKRGGMPVALGWGDHNLKD